MLGIKAPYRNCRCLEKTATLVEGRTLSAARARMAAPTRRLRREMEGTRVVICLLEFRLSQAEMLGQRSLFRCCSACRRRDQFSQME